MKFIKRKTIYLYHIDTEYLRKLANIDARVISPDINETSGRPFVGIVVACSEIPYFVPLASPKEKHLNMNKDKDFLKIFDKHDTQFVLIKLRSFFSQKGDCYE